MRERNKKLVCKLVYKVNFGVALSQLGISTVSLGTDLFIHMVESNVDGSCLGTSNEVSDYH